MDKYYDYDVVPKMQLSGLCPLCNSILLEQNDLISDTILEFIKKCDYINCSFIFTERFIDDKTCMRCIRYE